MQEYDTPISLRMQEQDGREGNDLEMCFERLTSSSNKKKQLRVRVNNRLHPMKVVGGDADKFSTSLPESQFRECSDIVNMLDYQERRFQGLMKKAGMNHSDWLKDHAMTIAQQ